MSAQKALFLFLGNDMTNKSVTTAKDRQAADFDDSMFDITPKGLVISKAPTFQQWRNYGPKLFALGNAIPWAIGDWINYGEARWGDKYAQALETTLYDYGTLRNYASTCKRWDLSLRNDKLTLSHHTLLANEKLSSEQRTKLQTQAAEKKLSTRELADEIKHELREPVWELLLSGEYTFKSLVDSLEALGLLDDDELKLIVERRVKPPQEIDATYEPVDDIPY